MIKKLIYNYYYKKFMEENSKDDTKIDWKHWQKLDQNCERFK